MSDERARLFVALELPGAAREALIRWRSRAELGPSGLRLTAPESLHVTLCFLGSRPAAEIERIAAACRVHSQPPQLALSDAVWLPKRRPNVLAVRIDDPDGTASRLQATLARALHQGGWYEPERRPFLPHVTVARVPRGVTLRRVDVPPPPHTAFLGAEVTLYRSHLGRGGARYEALATAVVARCA